MLENATSKMRLMIGSALVLLGAGAAVYSAFQPWYNGRLGRHFGVDDLFDGITDTRAQVMGSIFLPMAIAALVAVIGVLMRSRMTITVAGLIVLATTAMWAIRQSQVSDGLTVGSDGGGMETGVANALFGGVSMLLGMAMMGNQRKAQARGKHRRGDLAPAAAEPAVYEPVPYEEEELPDNVTRLPDGIRGRDRAVAPPPDWEQTADGSPNGPRDHRDAA